MVVYIRGLWIIAIAFWSVLGERSEKGSNKLESRVSQLLEWNSRRSVITLSSDKFNAYVRSKPRNYSSVVMFTALKPGRGCSICKDAYDEYQIVANSWRYSNDYSSKLFFIMVDIDEDGVDAFQQLHITTAPTYFHFPPLGKRKPEDQYDVSRNSYQAEPLTKWVVERTGVPVNVMRPPNYTLLMIWLPVILLAFIIGYLKRENLHAIYEPKYWAIASMAWIFVMISGQMWNNIRGPPFAHKDPHTGATVSIGLVLLTFIRYLHCVYLHHRCIWLR
ncbi:Tumor suppressor candidate 3 [Geodia barretti]|uniref:Tumor suppressor candidate 3 n=1 Tax=Geodia barretti TaxID=519541 RepID=A0AA35WNH7_GEOBA|nr:Tumor suppressor candidate 3 [Geodia barretti]